MKNTEPGGFLSKHKEAIASILLCLAAVAVALFLHPAYETNDDTIMEALLFGYQGNRTSFLVYINRFLGCILYFLITYLPRINWYFIMQWSVCVSSLFILARTFIRKFKLGGFLLSILIIAACMEALYMVQYTKTAALAVIAGAIGLADSFQEKKNVFLRILSIWLIVMGSMIRFNAFVMVSPFLFCVVLHEFILIYKEHKEKLKGFIAIFSVTLLLTVSCYLAGIVIDKNTPGSEEFYRYNQYRTALTDYPINYSAIKDKKTLSEISMLSEWLNNDPEVFTTERLEQLSRECSVDHGFFSGETFRAFFTYYLPRAIQFEPLLMLALIGIVSFLFLSKRKYLVIPLAGFYVLLELYLCAAGRIGFHRVEYGILSALLISLLYMSEYSMPKVSDDINKLIRYFCIPLFMVMGIIAICSFPVRQHYTDSRYNNETNSSLEDITADKNYRYMVYTLNLRVDAKRNIYDLPTAYNDGFFYMGGWQEGTAIPGIGYSNHSGIEGNPWSACIDNDKVRLVLPKSEGKDNPWMNDIAAYISEHYGKQVKGVPEYANDAMQLFRVVSAE